MLPLPPPQDLHSIARTITHAAASNTRVGVVDARKHRQVHNATALYTSLKVTGRR